MNDINYNKEIEKIASVSIDWEQLSNKTILLTGASGMIGTYLIDLLMYRNQLYKQNITIIAIARNHQNLQERFVKYAGNEHLVLYSCDVNEKLCLDNWRCDYIIHAASNTHPTQYASDPIGTIMTNIVGLKNILDYAIASKTRRVVFLSSVEIYGENSGNIDLFSEDYCGYINCNTMRAGYPESKRAGEALCQAYLENKGLDVVIPRLSRVYGPTMRSSDSKAIAQFIKKAVAKEDIVLKSEGKQLFSYCYVADAVLALLWIMLYGESGRAYNVAGKESDLMLKEIAEYLAEQSDTRVVYELPDEVEKKGYSKASKATLDTSLLRSTGWESQYTMRAGLKETLSILR